jgi:hypothetical protein
MLHALHTRRLDRAFAGELEVGALVALRAHLAGCEPCQRRYERHLIAEAALPDGEERAAARLWREVTAIAALPERAGSRLPTRLRRWLIPATLAAAGLLLLLGRPGDDDPAFTPRGGVVAPGGPAPALHLFRAAAGGAPEPAGDRIHATDGLLFAYSNPGAAYSHLMVFALDEQQRVYWYYPAYERAGEDPEAVPLERGRSGVELGEVIRHPLPAGQVRLFALFLDRPLRVLAVEAAVAASYGAGRVPPAQDLPLGVAGARQESRLLEVRP